MKRRDFVRRAGLTAGLVPVLTATGGALLTPNRAEAFPNRPRTIYPKNWFGRARLPRGVDRSVLIIGGGIAGLSAALELAERGYRVVVREADTVLGGRLATRQLHTSAGEFAVEHGLHMWFDNYHVFRDIRERLGVMQYFRPYEDVHFVYRDYEDEVLASKPKVYPLNLLRLVKDSPNLGIFDAATQWGLLTDVMHYNHAHNYRHNDDETFESWARRKHIGDTFYNVLLQPAASVTLNNPSQISAAEMIMYMHLYMVSQPRAMDREITTVDHETAVIGPWRRHLEDLGVTFELGRACDGLRFEGGRAVGEVGRDESFDHVVLSCDVPGAQTVLNGSTAMDAASEDVVQGLMDKANEMRTAPAYKVARVWFDRRPDATRPDVIETPQHPPINLLAQFHLLEDESRRWAERTGGSVIEFHLYANNMWRDISDAQVWPTIAPVVNELLPEMRGARVIDYTVGSYENFTSFEVGQATARPNADFPKRLGCENLALAGDWINTDYPSALMERAVATGREAANHLMLADNVRQASITVTTKHGPGII